MKRVARLLRLVADLVDPPPRSESHSAVSSVIVSPPKADLNPERVQHAREIAVQLEELADALGHGRRYEGMRLHT